jgi:hypothetical protein
MHQNLKEVIEQGRSNDLLAAQKTVDAATPSNISPAADPGLRSLFTDIGATGDKAITMDALGDAFQQRIGEMHRRHRELHGGDNLPGLDVFMKAEDPELWKAKQVVDYSIGRHISKPGGPGQSYSAVIQGGLKAQDMLKTWGKRIGLAGAGAVGVGVLLTLLRNAIEERRRKREEEEDAG